MLYKCPKAKYNFPHTILLAFGCMPIQNRKAFEK